MSMGRLPPISSREWEPVSARPRGTAGELHGGYRTINGYSGYYPPFVEPFLKGLDERRADVLNAYLRAGDLYVIVRPDAEPALIELIISVPGATRLSTAGDARVYRLPRRLSVGDR